MPRAGLTPQVVTRAASSLVDREGPDALTITRVADDLGVRPPSLYNHIDGRDGLERLVALDGIDRLADACRAAVMGRSLGTAVRALAHAYRAFATAHPGVYLLLQRVRPEDTEYGARAARLLEPVLAMLSGYGLGGPDRVHAARTVRSALHGFVTLEQQSGFGLDVDVDDSFEWLLDALERGVTSPTPDHTGDDRGQVPDEWSVRHR
jgi:AcrR family transcriptional regulator